MTPEQLSVQLDESEEFIAALEATIRMFNRWAWILYVRPELRKAHGPGGEGNP